MAKGRQPEFTGPLEANDPAIDETVFFWAGHGVTPRIAMLGLGIEWDGREPDWIDVKLAMSAKSKGYYARPIRRAA